MTGFSFDVKALSLMPKRKARSNKGDFGRLLAVCGSEGMAGAAYLAAKAAYRTGAGLVEILTHKANLIPLQTLIPEAIVSTYDEGYDKNKILSSVERADTILIGCGLGQTPLSRELLSDLLKSKRGETQLVVDADGLNLLSKNRSLLKYVSGGIITPHFLEMSRLSGISVDEISENVEQTAYNFAKKYDLICVLKDHNTVVSDGGEDIYINRRGNSGMATAGSGDVLAGVIGGLLAQASRREEKESLLTYAALGVYIHSVAGDIAASELGEYSVMAGDIIDSIPAVLKRI